MSYEAIESKFIATPEKGEVSSLLIHPQRRKMVARSGAWCKHKHAPLNAPDDR